MSFSYVNKFVHVIFHYKQFVVYFYVMDIRTKIKEYLDKNGIMHAWLASKLDISRTHLSLVLNCVRPLSKRNLSIVNELWPGVTFSPTESLPEPEKEAT